MKVFQFIASLLIASFAASFISCACVSKNRGGEMTPAERKSAIDATLDWARLAPFPSTAQELTIKAEGGFFSRSFRAHFKATSNDIDSWVKRSPGLVGIEPTHVDGKRIYTITPGGGANRAEVTIRDDNSVDVYASWS